MATDVRSIDLTAHRAGPTAVRQLADWGADVIKIEEPGGPDVDATGSRRNGPDFQNLHRNKRSLTLNLKSPASTAPWVTAATSSAFLLPKVEYTAPVVSPARPAISLSVAAW